MYDLIVIGGGIVGMSAAYHAVLAGARTLLVDRADVGKASLAGAGIIAPQTSAIESEDWYKLALAAFAYYPQLVSKLQAAGISDTGYAPTFSLIVAVSEDEDERFAKAQQLMQMRQERFGSPTADQLYTLDDEGAKQLFPPIAPLRAGVCFKGAARVDAAKIMKAMQQVAQQRHGLHIRRDNVQRLIMRDDSLDAIVVSGERISANSFLIAGGAWSPALADQLNFKLPVVPQRGQIAHLMLPGVDTRDWPVILAFHGHYMVPWPDSRIMVGATREFVGYAPHTTVKGINELLSEALRVAPGLAEASIGEVKVGLRPGSPDSLPILGQLSTTKNVYLATGHGANGLQLGPYTAKLVAELALGQQPALALDGFSATRFT